MMAPHRYDVPFSIQLSCFVKLANFFKQLLVYRIELTKRFSKIKRDRETVYIFLTFDRNNHCFQLNQTFILVHTKLDIKCLPDTASVGVPNVTDGKLNGSVSTKFCKNIKAACCTFMVGSLSLPVLSFTRLKSASWLLCI